MVKKIISCLFLAASSLIFFSCTEEISVPSVVETEMQQVSLEVSLDDISGVSRTSLNGVNSVLWETGDSIGVFFKYNSSLYINTFVLSSGAGNSVARFTGYAPSGFSGPFCCFYPSKAATGSLMIDSNSRYYIQFNLPSVQKYREAGFAKGSNFAMGKVSSTSAFSSGISLKNVCSILQINIKGNKRIRKIELNDSQYFVSGNGVYLCTSFPDSPSSWNFQTSSSSSTSNVLTLDCGSEGVLLTETGKAFNFVIPYGRLDNGFKITIYDTEGGMMSKSAVASSNNLVSRSTLLNMPVIDYDPLPVSLISVKEPGVYSNPYGAIALEKSFISDGYQFIGKNDCFHIQNWNNGFAVKYTYPETLVKGQSYNLAMTLEWGTADPSFSSFTGLKYLTTVDGLAYFINADNSKAYVFGKNE